MMTEEKTCQSAPASHGIGRWRLPRLGRLGFGRRRSKEMGLFTLPSTNSNPKTREKKDAFRLRMSVEDSTLKTIPSNCGTELLIFSSINESRSPSTTPISLDCGETASISYGSDERDDDWMTMASPKGTKASPLGKDDSFESLSTDFSSSDSTLEGAHDEDDLRSFCSCEENWKVLPKSSPSIRVVRFADEEGLPMEEVCQLHTNHEEDVLDRNHYEELIVLCLSPQDRKFEFLHVGYFPRANIDELRRATNVQDLLHSIPRMATDILFQNAVFDDLYRITDCVKEVNGIGLERIPDDGTLLRDCNFRSNELVIAAMDGPQIDDLLQGVRPLLGNAKLMKRVRRSQISERGLKIITDDDDDDDDDDKQNLRMKGRTRGSRRRSRKGKPSLRRDRSPTNSSTKHLVDVYGNDAELGNLESCDRWDGEVTENTQGKLLQAAFMITAGTIFFSSIGI